MMKQKKRLNKSECQNGTKRFGKVSAYSHSRAFNCKFKDDRSAADVAILLVSCAAVPVTEEPCNCTLSSTTSWAGQICVRNCPCFERGYRCCAQCKCNRFGYTSQGNVCAIMVRRDGRIYRQKTNPRKRRKHTAEEKKVRATRQKIRRKQEKTRKKQQVDFFKLQEEEGKRIKNAMLAMESDPLR